MFKLLLLVAFVVQAHSLSHAARRNLQLSESQAPLAINIQSAKELEAQIVASIKEATIGSGIGSTENQQFNPFLSPSASPGNNGETSLSTLEAVDAEAEAEEEEEGNMAMGKKIVVVGPAPANVPAAEVLFGTLSFDGEGGGSGSGNMEAEIGDVTDKAKGEHGQNSDSSTATNSSALKSINFDKAEAAAAEAMLKDGMDARLLALATLGKEEPQQHTIHDAGKQMTDLVAEVASAPSLSLLAADAEAQEVDVAQPSSATVAEDEGIEKASEDTIMIPDKAAVGEAALEAQDRAVLKEWEDKVRKDPPVVPKPTGEMTAASISPQLTMAPVSVGSGIGTERVEYPVQGTTDVVIAKATADPIIINPEPEMKKVEFEKPALPFVLVPFKEASREANKNADKIIRNAEISESEQAAIQKEEYLTTMDDWDDRWSTSMTNLQGHASGYSNDLTQMVVDSYSDYAATASGTTRTALSEMAKAVPDISSGSELDGPENDVIKMVMS